ncbi:tetratricopeptide repeat protein [Paenibacillus sp. FA6]|uniref:tetratricopeptide repeat protein n=1 Tax=Paenibacillus sp. FA6 TaxID=3413029 RepID=UPI003F65E984
MAFDLFKKGTALNSPIAMQYLGRMYLNGYGCKKNISIAVNHLNKSAKLGNISAYAELGEIYLNHDKISNQTNAYNIWNIYLSSINRENYPLYSKDLKFVTTLFEHYHNHRTEIVFDQKDKLLFFKSDLLHYYQEKIKSTEMSTPIWYHSSHNEYSRAKIEYLKNELH